MGVGMKVIMGLRVIALVSTLAIVGLGAWAKIIVHDVEIRGNPVLQTSQLDPTVAQYWRDFFTAVTDGTVRIWISIATGSFAFLTSLLVILSTVLRRLQMPGSVGVPLELLSFCSMAVASGCMLSLAFNLNSFRSTKLETSGSADLAMFAMIIPVCRGLVTTAGAGSFLLLITTITAMIQACMRKRAKESCSFEPTASSLGMSHGYQTIAPPMPSSRPPTLYDPRKPLPKQLDEMPATEEEMHLVEKVVRIDSGLSVESQEATYDGKDETWPLNPENSQKTRPSRPWSNTPQKKGTVTHAL